MTTTHTNPEPPIEWSPDFRHDDLSDLLPELLVVEQCCEANWLPLPSGEFVECPWHGEELRGC